MVNVNQPRDEPAQPAPTVTPTEARQGIQPHIVRYVLGISLVLAVLALGLTLAFAAA